jgi:hypothetical protein
VLLLLLLLLLYARIQSHMSLQQVQALLHAPCMSHQLQRFALHIMHCMFCCSLLSAGVCSL